MYSGNQSYPQFISVISWWFLPPFINLAKIRPTWTRVRLDPAVSGPQLSEPESPRPDDKLQNGRNHLYWLSMRALVIACPASGGHYSGIGVDKLQIGTGRCTVYCIVYSAPD
ncbi:hypothetical protein PoB_007052100 [Plakobranchus ocellatus]|uniref:Uncharacterized protein n=1 Tax=Plakobranchus ocellatus TaxID=259542 RepID=A0AAV4DIN9_9GAST|nr:hypothetical protein PoB_007052100 [Plakobranchus ocellatus]